MSKYCVKRYKNYEYMRDKNRFFKVKINVDKIDADLNGKLVSNNIEFLEEIRYEDLNKKLKGFCEFK